MAMSEPTSPRDELVTLLSEHEFVPSYPGSMTGSCRGCHPPHLRNMMGTDVYRAHLADVLLAAGWSKR